MSLENLEIAAEKIITNITAKEDLGYKNEISECLESIQDRYTNIYWYLYGFLYSDFIFNDKENGL